MIIPFSIRPRLISGIGAMEPITPLCEGDMARMSPESKITRNHPLRTVRLSLIYVSITPTNVELYEATLGKLDT